jgi:type VI secretion system protein ImpE
LNSLDALRSGDLVAAVDGAKQDVRKAPRDPRMRTFLFQLFCVTGEWDRALTQLQVVRDLDAQADAMVTTYQAAIRCEILREKVFRGQRSPTVFGDPGDWVPLLIEATRLLAAGEFAQAAELRDTAFDKAPTTAAILDETNAEWVADADPRLGPVIEAIIEGRYMWIPYDRIKVMRIEPPADLRDQVWMPAHFTWTNDGETVALIPTRYPGSAASTDPLIQLSRKTDWTEIDESWSIPIGQRMFTTDVGDTALMDLRKLTIQHETADSPAMPVPEPVAEE